jgi:hypothetical protein
MGLANLLKDEKFNIFFSFMVGIGIMCMIRPMCTGSDCNLNKAPSDKDFDKHAYRMGTGKCYEFKSEVTECPASGAIEAFRQPMLPHAELPSFRDQFSRRGTSITQRD